MSGSLVVMKPSIHISLMSGSLALAPSESHWHPTTAMVPQLTRFPSEALPTQIVAFNQSDAVGRSAIATTICLLSAFAATQRDSFWERWPKLSALGLMDCAIWHVLLGSVLSARLSCRISVCSRVPLSFIWLVPQNFCPVKSRFVQPSPAAAKSTQLF